MYGHGIAVLQEVGQEGFGRIKAIPGAGRQCIDFDEDYWYSLPERIATGLLAYGFSFFAPGQSVANALPNRHIDPPREGERHAEL